MKHAIVVFSLSLKIGSEFQSEKNEGIKSSLCNFITFLFSTKLVFSLKLVKRDLRNQARAVPVTRIHPKDVLLTPQAC